MTFNAADDPLGIAVQGRAQAARQKQHLDDWGHPTFGPLPDPKWDGFFQAMGEQGVTGLADDSVGVKKGMFSATPDLPDTYDPTRNQVTSLKGPVGRSNQINSRALPSMNGLDGAMKPRK